MLSHRALVVIALATLAGAAHADTLRPYSRAGDISRSEGLQTVREFLPAADPRPGLLLNAEPWPSNRVDSPFRAQNGRLWATRGNIGSRTVVGELPYGYPGPAAYGAPASGIDDIIFVRSKTGLPMVAISPWTTINSDTTDLISSEVPFLWRSLSLTSTRTPEIRRELERAQHLWLREQGYIQTVRQHVNLRARAAAEHVDNRREVEPSAIIRMHPPKPLEASRPTNDADRPAPIVRVSNGEARRVDSDRVVIRVVRPGESSQDAAERGKQDNTTDEADSKTVASKD
ncbi:MAG: hypothetical protein EA380_00645 [Phycisphaeraceae bacterium]|nr:MAG: hypothetical protein EA380_00645 [Phycisphaeraceae bacterium]